MTQRTFALTLLLLIALITRAFPSSDSLFSHWREETVLAKPIDAESLLASGYPLPLICADISSLELIPGISDKTAVQLLEKRDSIIREERHGSIEESLQLARGIGTKTATRLARYLVANGVCDNAEPYSPLTPAAW